MSRLRLSLIWHMHQPFYLDPVEGSFSLPWVRLHSLKDYLDMPLLASAHEGSVVNFNLVPSLIEQWEAWEKGSQDRIQALCERPTSGLADAERGELCEWLFRAHPETMIAPFQEFASLHKRWQRGGAAAIGNEELIRLRYWFHLAWLDPLFREEALPAALLASPEKMTEEAWSEFSAYMDKFPSRLCDTYGRLHDEGRIEVSLTPFYHPILPLLIDHTSALETMPDVELPNETIAFPDDARWHLRSAKKAFRDQLKIDPMGVWPSEGSVSEAALAIMAEEGFAWAASDEQVLANSLGLPSLHLPSAERAALLYRPVCRRFGDAKINMVFRDHFLSDRIGFSYATWDPEAAVDDFMSHLDRIRCDAPQAEPLATVILDGENCWEYYRGDGREFLEQLYARLAETEWLDLGSVSRHISELPAEELDRVKAGSWIDANFSIWIGHRDDRRAWELLAGARRELVSHSDGKHPLRDEDMPPEIQRAWRALFAAEGSDWNWWYGDDHNSDDDAEFDRLYRSHLRAIYEGCGAEAPKDLYEPIPEAKGRRGGLVPIGLSDINIDGLETHYYEWSNAARWSVRGTGGAMTAVDLLLDKLHLAFCAKALCLRIDLDRAGSGYKHLTRLSLDFTGPFLHRFRFDLKSDGGLAVSEASDGERWLTRETAARHALGNLLEIEIPWSELPARAGQDLFFTLTFLGEAGILEVDPAGYPLVFSMPDPDYDRVMWRV